MVQKVLYEDRNLIRKLVETLNLLIVKSNLKVPTNRLKKTDLPH